MRSISSIINIWCRYQLFTFKNAWLNLVDFYSNSDVEAAANTTCEEMEDKSMDMDPREARLKLNRSLFQDVDDK